MNQSVSNSISQTSIRNIEQKPHFPNTQAHSLSICFYDYQQSKYLRPYIKKLKDVVKDFKQKTDDEKVKYLYRFLLQKMKETEGYKTIKERLRNQQNLAFRKFSVDSLEDIVQELEEKNAQNFIKFFNGVSKKIPSLQVFLKNLEGKDLEEKKSPVHTALLIQDWIQNHPTIFKVDTLDMNYLSIYQLPSQISYLFLLKELDLSNNCLLVLSEKIGELVELRLLKLNHNQLKFLPVEIKALTKLHTLYLNDNKLISLPKEFGLLSSLRILQLEYNPPIKIPKEVLSSSNPIIRNAIERLNQEN